MVANLTVKPTTCQVQKREKKNVPYAAGISAQRAAPAQQERKQHKAQQALYYVQRHTHGGGTCKGTQKKRTKL